MTIFVTTCDNFCPTRYGMAAPIFIPYVVLRRFGMVLALLHCSCQLLKIGENKRNVDNLLITCWYAGDKLWITFSGVSNYLKSLRKFA